MESDISPFIQNEASIIENRSFWGRVLMRAVAYVLITVWLSNVRATASLWLLWPLIGIQLLLYVSIFWACFNRTKEMRLNGVIASVVFTTLALIGRVENWEIYVIPGTIAVMLVLSARNRHISPRLQSVLRPD